MQVHQASTAGSFWRPAGRFVGELAEMCFAMCAGGIILNLAVFGAVGLAGHSNFAQRYPEVSMLVIGVDWAVAMGAWMAFRRHPWRHNVEMSSTAIVATALFATASSTGLIRVETTLGWFSLFTFLCGPACALMALDMLYRREHYTGSHNADVHA